MLPRQFKARASYCYTPCRTCHEFSTTGSRESINRATAAISFDQQFQHSLQTYLIKIHFGS